jgi:hypothetical protein
MSRKNDTKHLKLKIYIIIYDNMFDTFKGRGGISRSHMKFEADGT